MHPSRAAFRRLTLLCGILLLAVIPAARSAGASTPDACKTKASCNSMVKVVPHPTPNVVADPLLRDASRDCSVRKSFTKHESLSRRLKDWLGGAIQIADTGLFTTPTGKAAKVGLLYLGVYPGSATPSAAGYQGIILGSKVVDGHLIVLVGFEDVACKHFYVPFNGGLIDGSGPLLYFFHRPGKNFGIDRTNDFLERLPIAVAQSRLPGLVFHPVFVTSYLDTSHYDVSTLSAEEGQAIAMADKQLDIARLVSSYLDRTSYFRPSKGLSRFSLVNTVPTSVDEAALPYMRDLTVISSGS
jgi:hypothetical protein